MICSKVYRRFLRSLENGGGYVIQAALFGIIASLAAMKIKSIRPEIGLAIGLVSGMILAGYALNEMREVIPGFQRAIFRFCKTDRHIFFV